MLFEFLNTILERGKGEPGGEKREEGEMGLGSWAGPWAFKFS